MLVVPYHRDQVYLFEWLGLTQEATLEPKPGVPPSPGHLAELLTRFKAQPPHAITRNAYQDPKPVEWLSEKTGIPGVELPYTVGGTPEAKDLFGLFDDTITRLLRATNKP